MASRVQSKLNPFAKEWLPNWVVPEEQRTLYFTFSNGNPISEFEIFRFFSKKYGNCLEKVEVQCPEPHKGPPLFGTAVFKSCTVPAVILAGKEDMKFDINGRTLWCKKYQPRKHGGD